MDSFLEITGVIQIVVEFLGFCPSRFYLRECSRSLHCEVNSIIHLDEKALLKALDRRMVKPEFLKLERIEISASLIDTLCTKIRSGIKCISLLENILQSVTIDELVTLKPWVFREILECSFYHFNVAIFDIAIKCVAAHGNVSAVMTRVLCDCEFERSPIRVDSLEWLRKMTEHVSLKENHYIAEHFMVCAIKFGAQRCIQHLQGFVRDWTQIDGILEACVYAGDLERVKILFSSNNHFADKIIKRELELAVKMRHLDVSKFLRSEYDKCHPNPSLYERERLAIDLADRVNNQVNHPLRESTMPEFVSFTFRGIDDVSIRKMGLQLKEAILTSNRTMCDYLAGRGCTLEWPDGTLEGKDLLEYIDLRLGLEEDYNYERYPTVELFLLKRGIRIRNGEDDRKSPLVRILWEGFEAASFANRVDLIKHYVGAEPASAMKICSLSRVPSPVCRYLSVTPLGLLELLGMPGTRIWDGKRVIGLADNASKPDEWELARPNEVEIQALRDIRTALVEGGADPEYLFASGGLQGLGWEGNIVPAAFVKRIIHGRAAVNYKIWNQECALTRAFKTFQPACVVKVLLDSGALVITSCDHLYGVKHGLNKADKDAHIMLWTALSTFTVFRNPGILPLIFERKANVNLPKYVVHGLTPLSWILAHNIDGKHEAAAVLLQCGADINARDKWGRTAIYRAIGLKDKEGVDLLIQHGADLSIGDDDGVLPIEMAQASVKYWNGSREIRETIRKHFTWKGERKFRCTGNFSDLQLPRFLEWLPAERRYSFW